MKTTKRQVIKILSKIFGENCFELGYFGKYSGYVLRIAMHPDDFETCRVFKISGWMSLDGMLFGDEAKWGLMQACARAKCNGSGWLDNSYLADDDPKLFKHIWKCCEKLPQASSIEELELKLIAMGD